MKKFIFIVAIISFFSCISFAHASTVNYNSTDVYILKASNGDTGNKCTTLLGDQGNENDPAYWIQKALIVMRYLGIALLLAYSTLDFVKAITEQDNDAVTKAAKKTGKRLIFAILLFFVPVIVSFLMTFLGLYGTCGLGESEGIGYVITE